MVCILEYSERSTDFYTQLSKAPCSYYFLDVDGWNRRMYGPFSFWARRVNFSLNNGQPPVRFFPLCLPLFSTRRELLLFRIVSVSGLSDALRLSHASVHKSLWKYSCYTRWQIWSLQARHKRNFGFVWALRRHCGNWPVKAVAKKSVLLDLYYVNMLCIIILESKSNI